MTDLLSSVIAAHGGLDRWRTVRAIDVTFNFSGGLLDLKGYPGHRPAVGFGGRCDTSDCLSEAGR
jgi:hypothetical protein